MQGSNPKFFMNYCILSVYRLASRVLCATLAIPLSGSRSDQLLDFEDNSVEKQKRLMNLLSLPSLPTRQSLVKDLVMSNTV